MTEKQRLKAQTLLLQSYIKSNPEIKKMLDGLIKGENIPETEQAKVLIEKDLKEARMIGINIGWQAGFLRIEEAIKNMDTIEEIKFYIHEEATKVRNSLSIKEPNTEATETETLV